LHLISECLTSFI